MNFNKTCLLILLFVLTIFSFGGSIETTSSTNESTNANHEVTTPIIDGIIDTEEYISEISPSNGEYQLYWQIEGDTIFLGMVTVPLIIPNTSLLGQIASRLARLDFISPQNNGRPEDRPYILGCIR